MYFFLNVLFLGMILVWIGGIVPSLFANVYEDTLKLIFLSSPADRPNPWLLLGRAIFVLLLSIGYTLSIAICTPIFIKKMWIKITTWVKSSIDFEEFRNALAPLPPPAPRITTS